MLKIRDLYMMLCPYQEGDTGPKPKEQKEEWHHLSFPMTIWRILCFLSPQHWFCLKVLVQYTTDCRCSQGTGDSGCPETSS